MQVAIYHLSAAAFIHDVSCTIIIDYNSSARGYSRSNSSYTSSQIYKIRQYTSNLIYDARKSKNESPCEKIVTHNIKLKTITSIYNNIHEIRF